MGLVFRGVSEGCVVLVEPVDEMEASAGVEMISVSSDVPKNSLYNQALIQKRSLCMIRQTMTTKLDFYLLQGNY